MFFIKSDYHIVPSPSTASSGTHGAFGGRQGGLIFQVCLGNYGQ